MNLLLRVHAFRGCTDIATGWAWLQEVLCSSEGVVLGSEEGLFSLALTVQRLLDIATGDSNGPSDEDISTDDNEILKDGCLNVEAASQVHPPLPKHPHDTVITTVCAIVFMTTVVLLYLFPLPS